MSEATNRQICDELHFEHHIRGVEGLLHKNYGLLYKKIQTYQN